jgi:hypothetical protein
MNECTQCEHCKRNCRLEEIWGGMVLIRKRERYIVAQVSAKMYNLIGIEDGNRWADPARSIEEILILANTEGFTRKGKKD